MLFEYLLTIINTFAWSDPDLPPGEQCDGTKLSVRRKHRICMPMALGTDMGDATGVAPCFGPDLPTRHTPSDVPKNFHKIDLLV